MDILFYINFPKNFYFEIDHLFPFLGFFPKIFIFYIGGLSDKPTFSQKFPEKFQLQHCPPYIDIEKGVY